MRLNEKITIVINAMNDAHTLYGREKNLAIFISPNEPISKIQRNELVNILKRLQLDKVIKLTAYRFKKVNADHTEQESITFELAMEFDNYVKKIVKTGSSKKQNLATNKQTINKNTTYQITYSTTSREILINNFIISKPDGFGENELVFSYLYEHPNKIISTEELEKSIGDKLSKSLHKIVENLGFNKEFKKVFFTVSGTKILFRNPITQNQLEEIGITRLKIKSR